MISLDCMRVVCQLHPFLILALTPAIKRGCVASASSAFGTIPHRDYRHKFFKLKFDFGDCFWLDAATMSDTVFLALLHVAIALVDFFFEPLVGNSFVGKYRQNAPCPHLIVPFPTERRGQSAKTLLFVLLGGN